MKPKTLILMLVAVACGLAASFMTSRYLAAQQQAPEDEEIQVLVATKNLPAYARLNDVNYFEVKQQKKADVSKDTVPEFERVKGRILKHPLAAGKPLAESDLIDVNQAGLTVKLDKGEVAMTVKATPDYASAGFILPGSRVDVVAFVTRGEGEGPSARTILQNKEVLAINHEMVTPEGTVNKQIERVTLRLRRGEEEMLAVYADSGQLRLVLRREDDDKIYETPGARVGGSKRNPLITEEAKVYDTAAAPPISAPAVPDKPVEAAKTEEKPKGPHYLDIYVGGEHKERLEFPDKPKPKDKKEGEKKDAK